MICRAVTNPSARRLEKDDRTSSAPGSPAPTTATAVAGVPQPTAFEAADWLVAELSRLAGVTYRRSGRGGSGSCPFHDDQQPSMSVFVGADGHARYRCHAASCGARGDTYDLAKHLGLPTAFERRNPGPWPAPQPSVDPDVAAAFVETLTPLDVAEPKAGATLAYLRRRGITRATCRSLDIRTGSDDQPARAASRAGVPNEDRIGWLEAAVHAGLARYDDRSGYRGRWARHVVVVVRDLAGIPQLISTRAGWRGPGDYRYWRINLVPAGTAVRLWPLQGPGVAEAIRTEGTVILVPGAIEAAALWQAGVRNVLAVFGDRSLTATEVEVLIRLGARHAVVAFHLDQDRGSRSRAFDAAREIGDRTGMRVLVDAFRLVDGGPTVDVDEIPSGRIRSEARRLTAAVRGLPEPRISEQGLVARQRAETRTLPRGLRPALLREIKAYREGGATARRDSGTSALGAPAGDTRNTFPLPSPPQDLPDLEVLIYLWFWQAQEGAWAGGVRGFLRVKQGTLARTFGVSRRRISRALSRLARQGLLLARRGPEAMAGIPRRNRSGTAAPGRPPRPEVCRYLALVPGVLGDDGREGTPVP